MEYTILVVEDQESISNIVIKYLEAEGYNALLASDGFSALELFGKENIHLALLDIMLPDIDGFEVLKEFRIISDIPVIMLTARQAEADKLRGFGTGADDYITKPFSARELVMRVKAVLKRTYHKQEELIYRYRGLELHSNSMRLFKDSSEIRITSVEFNILRTFFKNLGIVLSREQLIRMSFGNGYEGYDRNIDSYIKRLRKKIEADPGRPAVLKTKYGAGYIFGGRIE